MHGASLQKHPRDTTLLDIYQDIADTGTDTTSIVNYVTSWRDASLDTANWPDILLVTEHMLLNSALQYARWIGVDEGDLHNFADMSFDPSLQHETTVSVGNEDLAYKVMEVFKPVFELIYSLNNDEVETEEEVTT